MSNRNEVDQTYNKKIKKIIQYYPDCVSEYNTYLEKDKTSSTRYCYAKYICDFLDFIEDKYNIDIYDMDEYVKISPIYIDDYIDYISYKDVYGNKIKCSDSIKVAKLAAVNKFFVFLKENGHITTNPCSEKRIERTNKDAKEVTYMTPEEIKNVEKAIVTRKNKKYINRDLAIFMLGCGTGLRVSAIIGINVNDIDFENLRINNIEEKKKIKSILIPERVAEIIEKWLGEREEILEDDEEKTDALFINPSHKRITVNGVNQMIKRYSKIIGKNITSQKMRSTYGVNLYDKTGDIYLVQEMLGHANISNTSKYVRVVEANKKRLQVL